MDTSSFKNTTVAIIDDDPMFLEIVKAEVDSLGFLVKTFPSGEAFISHYMTQLKPDILVMDYHLDSVEWGAMNGAKVLRTFQKMKWTIPTIMLTSQNKIQRAIELMKLGGVDYVAKGSIKEGRLKKSLREIARSILFKQQYNEDVKKLKKSTTKLLISLSVIALALLLIIIL